MARVLITGCSTGIGRASAVELSERGHHVTATARRPETLEGLDVAATLALDVDDPASIEGAVEAAGEVDALVNNAGWAVVGPVERADLDEVRAMFETNVFGVCRMVQAVVPQMRERESGTIVNVGSVAGRVAGPLSAFYAATKHAVEAITESLHYELGHFGVRAVVIEPGFIATEFGANERHSGESEPPYDELRRQWDASAENLSGGDPPGPEIVGRAVAGAVEDPETPLRVPVGDDAQMIVGLRTTTDDATFEATMRETLGLTW